MGSGNASLSISAGAGGNSAEQAHTGESSVFLGVGEAWGAGQHKSPWILLPARLLSRTLEVFPAPCAVPAVQGSVGSWEASPRPGFFLKHPRLEC